MHTGACLYSVKAEYPGRKRWAWVRLRPEKIKRKLPRGRRRKEEDKMSTPWENEATKHSRNAHFPKWTPWLWTLKTGFGITWIKVCIQFHCSLVSYAILNIFLSFCNPLFSQFKLSTMPKHSVSWRSEKRQSLQYSESVWGTQKQNWA